MNSSNLTVGTYLLNPDMMDSLIMKNMLAAGQFESAQFMGGSCGDGTSELHRVRYA